MADYDEVVVINEGYEQRTSKSGKTRFTIRVTGEALRHNFDPKELGRKPAAAIAEVIRQKIKAITAVAAPATLRARKVAAKAFALGKPWATRRFGGGKMGPMAPNQSMTLFEDSGRLIKSIVAGFGKSSWRVNVAANRFDAATADHGGAAAVAAIYQRLVDLVPELGSPEKLLSEFTIRRAIEDSKVVTKLRAAYSKVVSELVQEVANVAGELRELAGDEEAA